MQPVTTVPAQLDRVQEWQLVIQARGNDRNAYHQLVEDCQRFSYVVARRMVAFYWARDGVRFDPMDLVSEGNVTILARWKSILSAANPCSMMRKAAINAMRKYCIEQAGPIRVPESSYRQCGARAPLVSSLDYPLNDDSCSTLLDLIAAPSL